MTKDDFNRKLLVWYNQDEGTVVGKQVIVNGEVVSNDIS